MSPASRRAGNAARPEPARRRLLAYLVRRWIRAEPDIAVNSEDLPDVKPLRNKSLINKDAEIGRAYHILDRKFGDGVIYLDQSLGYLVHECMPVFLGLPKVGVVHCRHTLA